MKLGGKLALLAPLIVVATLMGVVCFHHNLFTSIASRGDTTSKRDITDRPIWGRGPEETVDRFEPDSPGQGIAVELQRDLVVTEEKAQGSMDRFLELAQARFLERVGRPSTKADENWSFNHIQVSLTRDVKNSGRCVLFIQFISSRMSSGSTGGV